ncbi:MAG: IS66 family transposase [Candidatus Promineifilaceae bacterium]|jgi:transposase
MKKRFAPDDLNQISGESLNKMKKSDLIMLTLRLRDFGIELYERLNQDSSNSSRPPSTDSPYKSKNIHKEPEQSNKGEQKQDGNIADRDRPTDKDKSPEDRKDRLETDDGLKRNAGRQPGSQGFGRSGKPKVDHTVHHHPQQCIICSTQLDPQISPHTGHYTYELQRTENDIKITCTLHYYYSAVCQCGHENIERPGEGYESILEGRTRNVKLSEYTMVGPLLATFIAALSRRCGMSRNKIKEFLHTWLNFDLSIGLICKSIREVGIACNPVVDELINDLQKEDKVHLDETPWYQKGIFCWLWVAISKKTAIYRIGTRKKEQLLELITEAFLGWLITDGYGAYRSFAKRQRCLAHLIRKAVALTGAVSQEAQKAGDWFLRELRGLIKAMAQGEDGKKQCKPILARLKRACNLGSKSDHSKLKSLANEILNDWEAVVAFVKNPGLPATNNEAERALRWVVLYRKITFGTRTSEGSTSYAAMISIVETCRLRNIDPWNYIAQVLSLGRKGIVASPPGM